MNNNKIQFNNENKISSLFYPEMNRFYRNYYTCLNIGYIIGNNPN